LWWNYLNGTTTAADSDTLLASIESDYAREQADSAVGFRRNSAAVIGGGAALIAPILRAYVHHQIGLPDRDPQRVITRIYRYFADNSKSVESRSFTYGADGASSPAMTTGTNTGDGAVFRLVIDEDGFNVEALSQELKELKVISDGETGSNRHEESWRVLGAAPGTDLLTATTSGSGVTRVVPAVCSRNSLLSNPSFSSASIAAGLPATGAAVTLATGDTISNWTLSAAETNYQLTAVTADTFKDPVGDTTPRALRLLGNAGVSQTFATANIRFTTSTPYLLTLGIKRESSADGTITISWGSKSQAVSVSGLAAGWNLVALDRDRDLWPGRFTEPTTGTGVSIVWSGRSTGELVLDEVTLAPMVSIDGTFWQFVGSETRWKLDDAGAITDALSGTDSKIQRMLAVSFGRYLPHSGSPTLADP
jgi:hypothetical protein